MPHPFRGRRVSERTFTIAIVTFSFAVLMAVTVLSYLVLSNRQRLEGSRVDRIDVRIGQLERRKATTRHKRRPAHRRGSGRRASGRRSAPGARSPQAPPSAGQHGSPHHAHGHANSPAASGSPAPPAPPAAPGLPLPVLPPLPQIGLPPLPRLP